MMIIKAACAARGLDAEAGICASIEGIISAIITPVEIPNSSQHQETEDRARSQPDEAGRQSAIHQDGRQDHPVAVFGFLRRHFRSKNHQRHEQAAKPAE